MKKADFIVFHIVMLVYCRVNHIEAIESHGSLEKFDQGHWVNQVDRKGLILQPCGINGIRLACARNVLLFGRYLRLAVTIGGYGRM